MLKAVASAVFILGMTLAAYAQSTEETVTFQVDGSNVVGTLSVPVGDPAPVVLLVDQARATANSRTRPIRARWPMA